MNIFGCKENKYEVSNAEENWGKKSHRVIYFGMKLLLWEVYQPGSEVF